MVLLYKYGPEKLPKVLYESQTEKLLKIEVWSRKTAEVPYKSQTEKLLKIILSFATEMIFITLAISKGSTIGY